MPTPPATKVEIIYQNRRLAFSAKQRTGSDHLLLFLHGIGCAKECFDETFLAEDLKTYSLCALDLLGFGASDQPEDLEYTMEEHAETIKLALGQLTFAKISIIAHSMSGAPGLLLAETLDNLGGFVSVEGNLVAEDCGIVTRGLAAQSFEEFQDTGSDKFLNGIKSSPRPDLQAWARWYQRSSPRAIHAGARSVVEWSDSGRLLKIFNNLAHPTYIYGDESSKAFLLPHLTGAKVVKIANAGHFMMLDQPAEFYAAIGAAVLL